MNAWITIILAVLGTAFAVLAAVAAVRMPDLFTRMHGATKSSTLGVGCIILAVAFHFGELGVTASAVLVIAFLFLTAPVAAHMIGRAAYLTGVPLWDRSVMDELRYAREFPPETAHKDPTTDE